MEPKQRATRDSTTELPSLDGIRVLAVDDEVDAQLLLRKILIARGAIVETAGSVREALESMARAKPDVLISDIGMPAEDGFTMLRKVRELSAAAGGDVPAIALTAFARAEDRQRALVAGFKIHIAKPVEPAELIASVANLASRTK